MCSFITQHNATMLQVLRERAIGMLTAGMSIRALARELNVKNGGKNKSVAFIILFSVSKVANLFFRYVLLEAAHS